MAGPHKVEFTVGDGDGDPVEVELTFDRIVCNKHGEPFRSGWPSGFPTFSIAIFDDLSTDPEFVELVGGSTKLIHAALDRSPICERVGKYQLMGAYAKSDVGVEGTCANCDRVAEGTPYHTTVQYFDHLCFECIVYNLEPMQ